MIALLDSTDDVTIDEIVGATLKAKHKKAPGLDGIPSIIIREMILEETFLILKKSIQQFISERNIPACMERCQSHKSVLDWKT